MLAAVVVLLGSAASAAVADRLVPAVPVAAALLEPVVPVAVPHEPQLPVRVPQEPELPVLALPVHLRVPPNNLVLEVTKASVVQVTTSEEEVKTK